MPSAVIRWFRYAPEKRQLLIGFQSGKEYAYLDVPEQIFETMRRARSKGRFFNVHIRDHYRCVRRDEA